MNNDSLPKILFLHEDSEQMNDRRIRSKVQYDTSGQTPVKKVTKKINNTIDLTQNLHKDNQINRLAYSSQHGVMITCTDEEILLTGFQKFQSYLATPDTSKKSLKQISMAIKFSGKVYLTPDQSKFLAVNSQELMFFDISTLSPLSKAENQHSLRHFVFVNNEIFVGWNFQSEAYVYENIGSSKKLEGLERCTSINIINNHIVAFEKVNPAQEDEDTLLKIFNQSGSQILNEISLKQFDNPDMYIFNFAQVLSIFPIKQQKQGQFGKNDVYGLILGYYDDYEQQPDRRYLNFLKGDLLTKDSELSIRAFQLFLSPTEDRSFYFTEDQQKVPFQVQILTTGQIKIIMIEKLQVVFVVDCTQQFQKLNLYTLQPTNQIKLQDHKYFQGICLMKNMLEAQRKPPSKDSSQTCDMICKQFNGQFLSLYFSSKETQLTVPFPASVLVLGDNKIMRRYAVSTAQSVEEYEVDKLRQALNKIKKSSYIETVKSSTKVSSGQSVGMEKKSQQKVQVKEQKKKPEGLFGQPSNIPKAAQGGSLFAKKTETQQSKSASNSLFDTFNKASQHKSGFSLFSQQPTQTPTGSGSLFDNLPVTNKEEQTKKSSPIFGNTQPQPSTGGNLFANLSSTNKQEQAPVLGGIFEKKPAEEKKPVSLFNQNPEEGKKQAPTSGGLFGSVTQNKGSLFSQPQQLTPSLFVQAVKKQQEPSKQPQVKQKDQTPKQDKKPSTSLFNIPQAPILSQQKQPAKIDEKKQESKPLFGGLFTGQSKPFVLTVGTTSTNNPLFGSGQTQTQPQKPQGISFDAVNMFNKKAPVSQPIVKVEQKAPSATEQKNKSQVKLNVQQEQKKQASIKQQKPVQNSQKPLQLKSQKSVTSKQESTKSATIQRLQQLAQLMGFSSIQLIPSPLRQLTPQQADALIQSLQHMAKPKQQEKKLTPQQQAREKLLKKEHFGKILQQIDQGKDYLKRVKQANSMITSNKLFSLKNVKQMILREKPVLREKTQSELRSKNQLVNAVKEYVKKMELFARYQLQLQGGSANSRNRNSVQYKRQFVQSRVQQFEQHINRLTYYEQVVYPEDITLWGVTNNNNNDNKLSEQERWVEISKKKITTSEELIEKASRLLKLTSKSQLLLAPNISNINNKGLNKSASVATNLSSRQESKKKKGHFAFSVESSQSSGEQQPIREKDNTVTMKKSNVISFNSANTNNNYSNDYVSSNKKAKLLIKVKPQSIVLSPDITSPLIILPSTSTSPLYVPEQFNPLDLFKQSLPQQPSKSLPPQQQQPLQSSVKKIVNFTQRIPLKRDQAETKKSEIKVTKTIRFDQSQQLQKSDQQQHSFGSQQQADIVPNIGRTLSKFPQTTLQPIQNIKQPLITQSPKQPLQQKQQGISIKKTFQKQLPSTTITTSKPKEDKKDLAKQTKQAATAFTQAVNAYKKEQKPLSQQNITNTGSLFGAKSTQKIQQVKPTDKKDQPKTVTAPTSLFGAASGAASIFAANSKPVQQKKPSSTPGGLFSAKRPQSTTSTSPVSGLFGSLNIGGTTTTKAQQKSKENIPVIPDAKKQQSQTSKQQSKDKKQQPPKQQKTLFANLTSDNKTQTLFGSQSSSAFTFASKSIAQKPKDQQSKQNTVVTAVESDVKAAQKAAGQEKKETKPAASLFGASTENKGSLFGASTENKGSLFGNTTGGGLFGNANKTEQPKKQQKQTKVQNKQLVIGGGLFGPKSDDAIKTKNQAGQQVLKKPQEKKEITSLFGDKPTTTGQSLFTNLTSSVPQQQSSQQQQQLFGQNKPAFGAQNRFMSTNTQPQQQASQPQQTTGFNPTGVTFTPPTNAFGNTGGGGMKSFANFGDNKNTSTLFGQQQSAQNLLTAQQQQTNPLQQNAMFGQNAPQTNPIQQQSPLFGNTQQNTMFGQQLQQSPLFGQQQQQNPMFSQQQSTGMFGQPAQGGNTNFLSGFNPSGGMAMPTTAPSSNPMMLKPRK